MRENAKREEKGRDYNCATEIVEWNEHTSDCLACKLYRQYKKGGRPCKKRRKRGRPSATETTKVSFMELKSRVESVAGPIYKVNTPLSPARFISLVGLKHLLCPLCNTVVDSPVETSCGHVVCAPCCTSWLDDTRARGGEPSCPRCFTQFACSGDINALSPVLQGVLGDLQLHCDNRCSAVVTLQQLREHLQHCHPPTIRASPSSAIISPSPTPHSPPPSPPPSTSTANTLTPTKISAILNRSADTPLSKEEKKPCSRTMRCVCVCVCIIV